MNVNGRAEGMLLNVTVGGEPLQCETVADFSYSIEMLPATNPEEGRWRNFIPGVQTWSVTVNGHLLLESLGADFKTLVESARNGEKLLIRFGTLAGVTPEYAIEGYAYPSNLGLNAPTTGFAGWTVTFQGAGAFSTDWEAFGQESQSLGGRWPEIKEEDE